MAKQLVLRSQANEILALVEAVGLEPAAFAWKEVPSYVTRHLMVSGLFHEATPFYFRFDFKEGLAHADFSPGDEKQVDVQYPGDWSGQVRLAKAWLENLKREVEAPDLWAAVAAGAQLVGGTDEVTSDALFSTAEQERIAAGVRELKEYIRRIHNVDDDRWLIVSRQLDYLMGAASRVGRKDWLLLAAGTLANVALSAGLNPEGTQDIFRFAGQVLGWVFGHPHLLP
jgi:hypothetical protein